MDNKSKTRQKRKTRIARLVVTLCFGAYVLMIMWNNHKLIITHAKSLINGQARIGESINKISDGLRNDFADKYDYINLNGLFTRLAGKRKNNEVVLLNDGTETEPRPYREMKDRAKNMIDFSQWLEGRGIPFLYVQAPDKVDIEGTVLPVGISDNSNAEADELLSLLNRAGVRTLDLRPFTVDTQENSRYYFYDTDHHWNPRGGFVGYQKIAEAIQNIFPEINYDESYLEPDQWNLHTKEKWFLGSRGRRVGIYFGGVDDLIWYTPAFETKISCSIPFDNQFYKGQFEDAFIRLEHIKSEKADYFITEHYNMYVGRDFALVQQRNPAAKSALKVLMIKPKSRRMRTQ